MGGHPGRMEDLLRAASHGGGGGHAGAAGAAATTVVAPTAIEAAAPPRVASLTRLRLLLIGWVVVYHLELALRALQGIPVAEHVALRGYLGVDGFFLLSGFALWLGYHGRPPHGLDGYRRFLVRRLARIWPLHAAALLALAGLVGLAAAAGLTINDPERFGAREFWLQLALINAWETTDVHAWNYPSWALSAEWAGYLAFPVVLVAVMRAPVALLAPLAAACLGVLVWLGGEAMPGLNHTLHLGLVRFGAEFVLGMAVARLCTGGHMPAAATVAIAAVAIPIGLWWRMDPLTVVGLVALIASLYLLGRDGPRAAGGPPRDLVWRLGEASFGVYLCWVFVEAVLVLVLRATDPGQGLRLALMGGGLAVNLAAGWLAWRYVEVPAARWVQSRLG